MPSRISNKEAQRLGIVEKRHKMNAVATVVDGIKFPSKHEALRYMDYKNLQRAGKIKNLIRQKPYLIAYNGIKICTWRSDFEYDDLDDKHHIIDAKGYKTPVYKLKKRLVEAFHGITIEEV